MFRHNFGLQDGMLIRISPEDQPYVERVRDILLAEPCRGVSTEPHQLLSHMYIGSQNNAENLRLLRRLGITHVLNCAGFKGQRKQPERSPYDGLNIDYYEFKAEDYDTYDIVRHFHEAFTFLDRVYRKGGVALVHCAMGINRSAATCVGYIMHHRSWPLLKVVQLIKDKRRVVLSNKGFQLQLVRYARSVGMLDKLGDKPTTRRRESRPREPPAARFCRELPPSNYHRERQSHSSKPILEAFNSTHYRQLRANRERLEADGRRSPHRRSSVDYKDLREDGTLDLLGICIREQLARRQRPSSVDRFNQNYRIY
ncbi:hypothetical protein LSH36_433g03172 [Paralvinella palmiformis]|uniref:protein-tyrosine-phosphatase n=1 Tax=Paralvinella palmiformis TaxID=53620 RepID=A0AAD9JBQ5_9ANNE|nr:hypothetical protein LSH36_433g03172 [Paralvinella palmiformis]